MKNNNNIIIINENTQYLCVAEGTETSHFIYEVLMAMRLSTTPTDF